MSNLTLYCMFWYIAGEFYIYLIYPFPEIPIGFTHRCVPKPKLTMTHQIFDLRAYIIQSKYLYSGS